MEQDKHLKEILLNGSEIASADFTDAIMKRINVLSTIPFYYQPLVSSKLKKAFAYTFVVLVLFILLLCLIIGSPNIPFSSLIETPPLSVYTCYKILVFIFLFWILFTVNTFIQKNKLKLY